MGAVSRPMMRLLVTIANRIIISGVASTPLRNADQYNARIGSIAVKLRTTPPIVAIAIVP